MFFKLGLNSNLINNLLENPYEVSRKLLCESPWMLFSEDLDTADRWSFDTDGTLTMKSGEKEIKMDWDLLGNELIVSVKGFTVLQVDVFAYQNYYLGLFTKDNESVVLLISFRKMAEVRAIMNN